VAEHHDSERLAGSSPEVLIAHLLAKTKNIRIGSGGVMLQHYSPYKVAENFSVLASLAPGRVDLGIGRAPGGLPRSTRALQQDVGEHVTPLSDKLAQLQQFLYTGLDVNHPLYGLEVTPKPNQPPEVYLLGASTESARLAADLGLHYVFALFINGDETVLVKALDTYRAHFQTKFAPVPEFILALSVIVADTDAEAKELARDVKNVKVHLESERSVTVGSIEQAEEFGRQSQENYTVEVKDANIIHGSKLTVQQKLLDIQERTQVQELIVVNVIQDFRKRVRSYELLRDALDLAYIS
jgi:luciferase family oxidoreductase group 1